MNQALLTTDIPGLPQFIQGKVRDVYDLGDALLIVATDRLSAFDVILPTGIPGKGRVLTALSQFWFEKTAHIVPNHLIACDMNTIGTSLNDAGVTVTADLISMLEGRTQLVRKCAALPLECVVRGYLEGSAWKDYQTLFGHGGEVMLYDIAVPIGLRQGDPFLTPLFTPAAKAHSGHDTNVTFAQATEIVGADTAAELSRISITLYDFARNYAAERGIVIADTKFEFGLLDGQLILIDEALTPDSSRFWEASLYKPGKAQASFDKQFVRDYLETLSWDKTYPGPELPAGIAEKTAAKYRDAYQRLTGEELMS
ncbi:MAG: phosphoribosylaminoimidazolesuccinocarboxamide synthase [Janthinobacterium lividum]